MSVAVTPLLASLNRSSYACSSSTQGTHVNEDKESATPEHEHTAADESGVIPELSQQNAPSNETENVRGGASLPPDKRRDIATGM